MQPPADIHVSSEAIAAFCRRHQIRKLALFGSVLRDELGPDSDVDVLVEFAPGQTPGYGFIRIERELSELFGRRVDLVTFKALNHRLRDQILASAAVQYEQG